jgi:lysophospholipase L1-like esterase
VAEGDSWFQYPILVRDILDHLYRLYAVCSFSEAGDTLENYMKKREYLPALNREKADFFLVSGGGNDILGEQFRGSLRETPDANDNTPRRYLNETFFNKLDKLQDWYIEMFAELLNTHPQIHILTHSYDYIIPVNTTAEPKKTSWLGKYMIEKKIEPQAEREQLISFMVDQFNDRLQVAAQRFPNRISYIDVRGLVPRDSWFDEIHPTNSGFQLVADKFIAEIERLRKS